VASRIHGEEEVVTKRKDPTPAFLEEAERIEREEIQIEDEEAEGRWVFVRPHPAKQPSQVYSVRLPATLVEELRVLASAKGEAPTALIREWVLDRMERELDQLPEARTASGGGGGTPPVPMKGAKRITTKKTRQAPGRSKGSARTSKSAGSRRSGGRSN
jgi:hypothetical protein